MRIGAGNDLAGECDSLSHELMADPATDIRELESRRAGKVPQFVLEICSGGIVCRHDMVKEDICPGRMAHFSDPKCPERLIGQYSRAIMHIGTIHLAINILPLASCEDPL